MGEYGVGDVVGGRYRLDRAVARGGMGEVFAGHDTTLDQVVALKHVRFGELPGEEGAQARDRTLREARLAARLRDHPHVVTVFDVLTEAGDVWLVMEYVASRSLADRLDAEGRIAPPEAARIGAAVAAALAAAHAQGVVHRDVKPGNVLLDERGGAVKLADFGISRAADDRDERLTATGIVSGTPAYMAREVARGDDPTPPSDVYSLGATLYRAVEGRPPYAGDGNALRLMHRVATEPLDPPRHAGPLEPVLMRLLAGDASTRPDAALAGELLAGLAGPAVPPPVDASAASGGPAEGPSGPSGVASAAPPAGRPGSPTWAPGAGPPGAGPPGAGPGAPPPDDPHARTETTDPARGRRRRLRWGVLAGVGVLAVAAVLAWLLVPSTPSVPTDPVRLTFPAAELDTCPLLDPSSLQRYGTVSVGPGSAPAGCGALVRGPTDNFNVDLEPMNPGTSLIPGVSPPQPVGSIGIGRGDTPTGAGGASDCPRELFLSDGTQVSIRINSNGSIPVCALSDTVTDDAVRALAVDGLTRDPGRPARYSFGRTDACTTLTQEDLARDAPGISAESPHPGFANWSCSRGPGAEVTVRFALARPGANPSSSPPTVVDGRPAYVQPDSTGCQAWLRHRTGGLGGADEYLSVELRLAGRAPADQCGPALDLARVSSGRTP